MGVCASILEEALLPSFKIVDIVISSDNNDDSEAEYDTDANTFSVDEDDDYNSETIETVQNIDSHAKQVPKSFLKSFKALLGYFEIPLQDKKDKHQLLIRSFLTWLGGLDIPDAETLPSNDLKENDSRSPDEAAGIKCFKVKGVYKTDGYDNVASSEWAVVKINGAWQIVHPYRICRALSGKFPQGWLKSTTEDLNTRDVEILKTSFLDYYINPKPEQFIYELFPDDTEWQLLPDPITEKQFLKQELYHHTWWETGLRLTSKRQYRLTSTKGKVSITLHGTEQSVNNLVLWYDLNLLESIGETREDSHIHGHDYFQRSVFLVRNDTSWVCKVLLPVKGTYRIVFYGGKLHKPLTAICQFRLICKETYKDPVPLAVDPGRVGLGPGPFARIGGLISPTYQNGVIQLEMNNTLKLKFRVGYKLLECFKIKANLYNSNGIVLKRDTTSMVDCSISNTIQGKEVTITVTTPDDPGYYMLELLTNKDETKWTSACYYLLVYKALTQVFIERCSQKVRKNILMKVTETGDAHQIMVKIQDCTNKKFPENDLDIQKARGKVALLKTSKKKSQILSTIFTKESCDSSNIVSQSQY
ncbi:hillarin-like [Mytilus trossulus]|uniref:hillarin-like n=1 Tax=Mytilus trossulus TaxID=6551 RepID=UPI0030062C14